MKVWPGRPYPLGATWDGEGVNFALFSENATSVELCLFDGPDATRESQRIRLEERTNQTWHVYLPEGRPGLHYGHCVAACRWQPIVDDTFLVLSNAHHEPVEFLLPSSESSPTWRLTPVRRSQGSRTRLRLRLLGEGSPTRPRLDRSPSSAA